MHLAQIQSHPRLRGFPILPDLSSLPALLSIGADEGQSRVTKSNRCPRKRTVEGTQLIKIYSDKRVPTAKLKLTGAIGRSFVLNTPLKRLTNGEYPVIIIWINPSHRNSFVLHCVFFTAPQSCHFFCSLIHNYLSSVEICSFSYSMFEYTTI